MSRRYLYLPSPYTAMLRRATLIALLLACASGIALDRYVTSEMREYNQQLGTANDVLLSRANTGSIERAAKMDAVMSAPSGAATRLADRSTAPGDVISLATPQ
jgi:hypothetical protein